MNALSFDIEDYFHVENLSSKISRSEWDTFALRVQDNTEKILDILNDAGQRATFFILGWVAERRPDMVKQIAKRGHEVACHGYSHHLVYQQTRQQFKEDVLRSKQLLENITGLPVIGYRAPNFSIIKESLWAIDILQSCGFEYDSSIFPVSFHDRYGFPGIKRSMFRFPNGLIEVPLTVFKIMNVNLPAAGGAYFRFFPYRYFRFVFKRLNKHGNYAVFYLHPWELDVAQPKINVPFKYRLRHYFNIHKTEQKIKMLLNEFRFSPIKDLISREKCNI
jgi:polysaccharide deacetylase family protein (PEP-CTERM system associated)